MNHEETNRIYLLDLLLIGVFCAAFFGFRLGDYVPLTDHEGYVAVTAREALEGNWIVPHFDGQIRLQKTPLIYWVVAGFSLVFGRLDEWVVRLPSALAATGVALSMTVLGAKMFTRFTGLIAGLATASAAGMLWLSHVGTADMLMTFFVVISMVFFYLAFLKIDEGKSGWKWMMISYAGFSLAMLAKGPVPIVAAFLPMIVYLFWAGAEHRWPRIAEAGWSKPGTVIGEVVLGLWRYVRGLHLVWGVAIFLVIFGSWVVAVLVQVPDAGWRWQAEYIERYLGDFVRSRPMYYYIPLVFLLALPWSLFLPVGVALPFLQKLKGKRHELMFLFVWLTVGFVLFSLSGGKRPHYILPILPPAIMLSVAGMIYLLEHRIKRKWIFRGGIILIVLTIVAVVVGGGYVRMHYPQILPDYRAIGFILIIAEILALGLLLQVNVLASTTVIALASGIIFATIWPLYPLVADEATDPQVAAEAIRERVHPGSTVYWIGKVDGPLVFYYGETMPQVLENEDIIEIFKSGHSKKAILQLQEAIADRVVDLLEREERVYFITTEARFGIAKAYARQKDVPIYQSLHIPRFFAVDKGLILFGNSPGREMPAGILEP